MILLSEPTDFSRCLFGLEIGTKGDAIALALSNAINCANVMRPFEWEEQRLLDEA